MERLGRTDISSFSRVAVIAALVSVAACTASSGPTTTTGERSDPSTTTSVVATTRAMPTEADEHVAYVQQALEIIEEEFYKTDEVDWEPIREWAFNIVEDNPSTEGAHQAVDFALRALDAYHTALIRPGGMQDREPSRREPPSGERLEGDIGYLNLPGISSSTSSDQASGYAGQVRQSMEELDASDPVCGWILDIRESIGGRATGDWLGLGPLVGDNLLMHFGRADGAAQSVYYEDGVIRYKGARGEAELPARVPPGAYVPERVDRPIAVLISSRTGSAGEAIAITFADRPHTRSFGERTGGATISSEVYEMPDGAFLRIASGLYQDHNGRGYEQGLPPDEPVRAIRDSEDHVLDAAVEWLHETESCETSTG